MEESENHNLDTKDVDNNEKHDELMIDLTRERIEQEISNLSADETKSSIIIGVVSAVFGITFTVNEYLNDLLRYWWAWVPIALLSLSFIVSLFVVLPKGRLRLIKPRESDSYYKSKSMLEVKKELKKELIENFEFIENARRNNPIWICLGFVSLISGTAGIFMYMLLFT